MCDIIFSRIFLGFPLLLWMAGKVSFVIPLLKDLRISSRIGTQITLKYLTFQLRGIGTIAALVRVKIHNNWILFHSGQRDKLKPITRFGITRRGQCSSEKNLYARSEDDVTYDTKCLFFLVVS